METTEIIHSQYNATLGMMRQVIEKCPEALWDTPPDQNQFWHIAYHALFYTHLYLQPEARDFSTWIKHQADSELLGRKAWAPEEEIAPCRPYTKAELFEYLEFCLSQVAFQMQNFNVDAPSGFPWLPLGKLELQFYSIRHLQQHIGELSERLGKAGINVDWIGSSPIGKA
jgi:hypothetical protein